MKRIKLITVLATAAWFFSCSDDFSSGMVLEDLTEEEKSWLVDYDGDGVADSIGKYAENCDLAVEECLNTAVSEKQRIVDSLTLPKPAVSLSTGSYDKVIYVELSTSVNAILRFTLDGSDPTRNSRAYTSPIKIDSSAVLKARAFNPDFYASPVTEAEYLIVVYDKLDPPQFNREGGTYDSAFNLTLTTPVANADVFYTLKDSDPVAISDLYTSPLAITRSTDITAIAAKQGFLQSDAVSAVYELKAKTPVADLGEGSYSEVISVRLSAPTPGSIIHFTTDNSDPNDSSQIYMDPIQISVNTTLRARAFKKGWTNSDLLQQQYTISIAGTASGATFNPPGGIYNSIREVVLLTTTDSGKIHFTVDGSKPDSTSKLYEGPVKVDSNTIIQARVYKAGLQSSAEASASYRLRPDAPEILPDSGTYEKAMFMTINPPPVSDAVVRYTVNGGDPDGKAQVYSSPVLINHTQTVRARAFKSGWDPGKVDTADYVISIPGIVSAPEFQPQSATFTNSVKVTLTTTTSGADIYYTDDETTPDRNSTFYVRPITITRTTIIKAVAVMDGMQDSPEISAGYIIEENDSVAAPVFHPEAKSFYEPVWITITSSTQGADIYFTVNGDPPTVKSTRYKDSVYLDSSAILRAIAVKSGMTNSSVSIAHFEILKPPAIEFSHPAGELPRGTRVGLAADPPRGVIRFTADGKKPTKNSDVYADSIVIDTALTITAGVWVNGNLAGDIAARTYTVAKPPGSIEYIGPQGKALNPGSTERISWKASEEVGAVVLEYRYDGNPYTGIVSNYGSETYDWTVPNHPTSSLWIRVRNVDVTLADSNDAALSIASPGITTLEDVFIKDQAEIPLNKYKAFYWDDTNGTTTPYHTEVIARPVVNFTHGFHNIPGQSFSAYWVGNFEFSKAVTRGIYAMLGQARVRIIIDKREVYKGTSNASLTHLFSAGLHKIEVEYSSNYFSTTFDMKVIPEIQYTSDKALKDALMDYDAAKFWYAGIWDNFTTLNEQKVELKENGKPVVLFLATADVSVWDFSAADTDRIAAIVLASRRSTATLEGIPESVEVYYNQNLPIIYSTDKLAELRQFMEGTLGITLSGFTGHYDKKFILIPELILESAKNE